MATVNGLTAEAMAAIRDGAITGATINGSGHLVLTHYDASTTDLGNVIGPQGSTASATTTTPGLVELATTAEALAGTNTTDAITPATLNSVIVKTIALVGNIDTAYNGWGLPKVLVGATLVTIIGMPLNYAPQAGDPVGLIQTASGLVISEVYETSTPFPVYQNITPLLGLVNYQQDPNVVGSDWATTNIGYALFSVGRTSAGFVHVRGLLRAPIGMSTIAANSIIGVLPSWARPLQRKRIIIDYGGTMTGAIIETTGAIIVEAAITATTYIIFNAHWVNDPALVWTAITLTSPWVNFGGTDGVARYTKDAYNRVWTEGLIKSGGATSNIWSAPSGYSWTAGGTLFLTYELLAATRMSRVDFAASPTFTSGIMQATNAPAGTSTGRSIDLDTPTTSAYTTPPFVSGANYGSSWNTVGYQQFPDKSVRLQGLVTTSAAAVIFYLPIGMRPKFINSFPVESGDVVNGGRVDVYPDGRVICQAYGGGYVSLENIEFIAEQ